MADYFLGVDWGGSRIKMGAVLASGHIIAREIIATPVLDNIEPTYRELVSRLELVVRQLGPPLGIGLALTGPTNPELGTVLLPGKIRGLEGFPLVPRLRAEFRVDVWATNDGMAALYAEKYLGLARNVGWAASLTI